jgi:hypothetical protein
MSDEESFDIVHGQTVPTEHRDERLMRLPPQAIPPRAPVPPTAAEKRQIRAATKTVATKPFPVGCYQHGLFTTEAIEERTVVLSLLRRT